MKMSTRARYALRLMIDLADQDRSEGPTRLQDIAKRQNISRRYLEQLAINLKNANLLLVTCGRGGGYRLRAPADQIRVLDVVQATIGPINIVDCVDHAVSCSRSPKCPSRVMWVELNRHIKKVLGDYTLADLSEFCASGRLPLPELDAGGCPDGFFEELEL